MMKPKEKRQQELQSKFNFQCKCDRCEKWQFELCSLLPNIRIKLDPNFQFMTRITSSDRNYQQILSSKATTFDLLKKYKDVVWSEEVSRIIYHLFSLALKETESVSGGIPFTGRHFNMQFD